MSLYRITENAKNAKGAWDTKLIHADKFDDLLEALKRITDLESRLASTESRLAFMEQSRLNKP